MYYLNYENPTCKRENSAYLNRLSLLWGNLDELWGDLDIIEQELYPEKK